MSLPSLDISSGIWLRIQCDLCSVGTEGTVKARPPLELCNRLQNGRVGFSTCSALKRDSELPTRKVGIADISNTLNRILKLAEILRSNLAVMLLVKGLGGGGTVTVASGVKKKKCLLFPSCHLKTPGRVEFLQNEYLMNVITNDLHPSSNIFNAAHSNKCSASRVNLYVPSNQKRKLLSVQNIGLRLSVIRY